MDYSSLIWKYKDKNSMSQRQWFLMFEDICKNRFLNYNDGEWAEYSSEAVPVWLSVFLGDS